MTDRRAWLWRALLLAVLVVNTVLELSSAVGNWWGRSSQSTSVLPLVLQDVVDQRPDTSEGDVHLVLWFVAAALLVLAVRTWRTRVPGLFALWLYSGVIELVQPLTDRSGEWSDFGANALGILGAAVAMLIAERITSSRRRARDRAGARSEATEGASAESRMATPTS